MGAVVVAGHVCVDVIPDLPAGAGIAPGELVEVGAARVSLGGCVGNTGLDLVALGAEVRLAATIGDDALGRLVVDQFDERGLATTGLAQVEDLATSYSVIIEIDGRDRAIWHHPGANSSFNGASVHVEDADLVHIGYPTLLPGLLAFGAAPLIGLLRRSRAVGVTTSVDLAVLDPASPTAQIDWQALFAATLPLVDLFTPSVDDLVSALAPGGDRSLEAAAWYAEWAVDSGVAVAAVSAGEAGTALAVAGRARLQDAGRAFASLGHWAGARHRAPAIRPEVMVTTNGAGDALSAGLIHAITTAAAPADALRFASATAAVVMSGHPPTQDRVWALLNP